MSEKKWYSNELTWIACMIFLVIGLVLGNLDFRSDLKTVKSDLQEKTKLYDLAVESNNNCGNTINELKINQKSLNETYLNNSINTNATWYNYTNGLIQECRNLQQQQYNDGMQEAVNQILYQITIEGYVKLKVPGNRELTLVPYVSPNQ